MTKRARKTLDPAVSRELKALRRAHPHLADDADAQRQMERLASMRVLFHELDSEVRRLGGAAQADMEQLAELRQLSRACSTLEAQLKKWFMPAPGADTFALMALMRRQALGLDPLDGGAIIDAQTELPVDSRVLLPRA